MRYLLFALLVCPVLAQEVYFSPHGGCTEATVKAINEAKVSIHVQAYGFTSVPIAQALVAAYKRGVKVEAVLDRSNRTAKKCQGKLLKSAGIPVLYDARHPISHEKAIMIDGRRVLAGSFNWTVQAEVNSEDLMVWDNEKLAGRFEANFKVHEGHSER